MNMHTTLSAERTSALPPPQPLGAETWHDTPAAIGIVAAIVDLSAIARRLEAIRIHQPHLHNVMDAESVVGRVSNKTVLREFGRGREMVAAPSNGTCAVASLWEMLRELRDGAIQQQMKVEGVPSPYGAGLTQEQADVAFDRREELDREALSVAQVVCLALSEGRA